MREKLETLSLLQLKELAKAQGLKVSALKKAQLIDLLCGQADAGKADGAADAAEKKAAEAPRSTGLDGADNAEKTARYEDAEAPRAGGQLSDTGSEAETAAAGQPMNHAETRGQEPERAPQERFIQERRSSYGMRTAASGRQQTDTRRFSQDGRGTAPRRYQERTPRDYDRTPRDYDRSPREYERPRSQEQRPQESRCTEVRSSEDGAETYSYSYQEARKPLISMDTGEQSPEISALDSGIEAHGILEVMSEGFGFIRCENYLPGDDDVYVAPSQIRRFNLKTGDIVRGNRRVKAPSERFAALLYITTVNGFPVAEAAGRKAFESLTPVFPNERIRLELGDRAPVPLRVMDLLAPIGKGQRGMIVSPPKAGKTTLLKQVAKSIITDPKMHLIILLIDERPEEVTDIREEVVGDNVEVIYSTFDELPERHKRVSEMVIERAKRLVEYGRDVTILLDSITRLARAYNLVVPPSGRTLSGGLDPAALHMPKRFFGAARKMREGGSLTILATALIDTGSRMDDVIYEEFKGTGNMELVLDRKLSERRIFPAIDVLKSGTRRDDLLLSKEEQEAVANIRKGFSALKPEEAVEKVLDLFTRTKNNRDFVAASGRVKFY